MKKRPDFTELSYPALILFGTGAFFLHFSVNDISNNTPEAIKSIAFFLPAVGALTAGFLHALFKRKPTGFYLLTIIFYFLLLVLMFVFAV